MLKQVRATVASLFHRQVITAATEARDATVQELTKRLEYDLRGVRLDKLKECIKATAVARGRHGKDRASFELPLSSIYQPDLNLPLSEALKPMVQAWVDQNLGSEFTVFRNGDHKFSIEWKNLTGQ